MRAMLASRPCIPEWRSLVPGRFQSRHSPRWKGRDLATLRVLNACEIRLLVNLTRFAGYARSSNLIVRVNNEEFNLELNGDSGSRSEALVDSASLRESGVLNGLLIVNRSLGCGGRNVTAKENAEVVRNGVSRLEMSSSACFSSTEARVTSLDCHRDEDQISGGLSAENVHGIGPGTELDLDDLDYYVPEIGHRVVGVVVSGIRTKLNVDIGAAKLGELKVSQIFPLDRFQAKHNKWIWPEEVDAGGTRGKISRPPHGRPCMVYDKEVFGYEAPALCIIDIGTVLELVVIGMSLSGNPILSARKAAQRTAWDRVKQMKELNQPIQVEVIDCNTSGALAKVEGLRAFLPLKEFVNRPKTFENYMGRKLWVTVTFANESCHSLVISERKAWVKRNLQPGSLHDGTVLEILPYGARVQVNRTNIMGLIHISNIAHALIEKVTDIFEVGEQIKMMVVNSGALNTVSFSTANLESEQGLMLRDKQRVFQEAEQTAHAWRVSSQGSEESLSHAEDSSAEAFPEAIANLEWLDFGKNGVSFV